VLARKEESGNRSKNIMTQSRMHGVRSAYRLQLDPQNRFGFREAQDLLWYLNALGSDLYLSPIAQAQPGSRHGYDMVDPDTIDPGRGGEGACGSVARAAGRLKRGVIVDLVHHMEDTPNANVFWRDEATRLKMFDIDPVTGARRGFLDFRNMVGVRTWDEEVLV